MVTLVLRGMTITMKHVVDNNGTPAYQRSVPKDLRHRIGKSLIKIQLDRAKGDISLQADNLTQKHTALFKAMREDPSLTVTEQKLAAIALLSGYGLKAGDLTPLSWPNVSVEHEGMAPQADAFLDDYIENKRDGKTTRVDDLAYRMLKEPLPLLLSEAIDIYFENHKRGKDPEYRKTSLAHWNRLIALTGDIALLSLDRDTAKKYMNTRLEKGLKTGSVKREMNILAAVVQKVIVETRLAIRNPFEHLVPQGYGLDASKKIVLSIQQLQEILDACRKADDEIRRIVILQMATGARIAEIVGLRKQDVSLTPTPSLTFREYFDSLGSRTLKTGNSNRSVPLVEFAAKAAKKQIIESGDSPYLFPRYNNGTVKSDAADATVNKWLKRTTGEAVTSHCFRHTIKTLLRGVTSKSISDQITGHSSGDIADDYGLGYSLSEQLKALKLALKAIK